MKLCKRHPLLTAWAVGVFVAIGWSANRLAGQEAPAAAGVPAERPATKQPAPPVAEKITPEQLDALVARQSPAATAPNASGDEAFLRRATFDLVGRQPTLDEQRQFAADVSPAKRHDLVERLLASDAFGVNWANYWSDTIAYRTPPPELTYLDYGPLKTWLAAKLNAGATWNEIARELLTAKGKVQDEPAATFVGYHQARATNLAAETSRIFLGQQIGCAECHDHPFDHWKRAEFHALAAFFARTKSKLPQNDGPGTVVSSADKGEYLTPDMADPKAKGTTTQPVFLGGETFDKGQGDAERRERLAAFVTAQSNPWFAKAYVNRIWARLMGRGFYEPVDDLGDSRKPTWPAVHDALAGHFTASGYDVKDLFRLITSSEAYARGVRIDEGHDPAVAGQPLRLRADEVFTALEVGVALPNVTPPKVAATGEFRFPPPPKSTQALINEAFGIDPSLSSGDTPRTMTQALWMMNNVQLQKQINATAGSGTMLAKLLEEERDDPAACQRLFARVLARKATPEELRIALGHIASVGDRGAAFEDLLWSLVNSAEFTTRR